MPNPFYGLGIFFRFHPFSLLPLLVRSALRHHGDRLVDRDVVRIHGVGQVDALHADAEEVAGLGLQDLDLRQLKRLQLQLLELTL